MVFAPNALLTATIESERDDDALHIHAGGQGVWQARMVRLLGARPVLCTVVGGEVGRLLEPLLEVEGLDVRAIHGTSGTGWHVQDRRDGKRTTVAAGKGSRLDRHEVDELYDLALAEGLRAPVSILGGPADPSLLEPDVYRRLATDLTTNGTKVVADLAGDFLTAALAGGPAVVKVAHDELVDDGRAKDESIGALSEAARVLRTEGARNVIVSRSDQPALALLEGEMLLVAPPVIQEVDPAGAGDSMTAAIATMLAQGSDLPTAVRVGVAAGAVNVSRHGLGTGHADAVAELATRVRFQPASERPYGAPGSGAGHQR